MPLYRILSLDGGGQLELTSCLLLSAIERQRPGFLAKTQMFAGTSAGAMAGMVFASVDDPAQKLPALQSFWEKFSFITMNDFLGTAMALFGVGALFQNRGLRDYLSRTDMLGTLKMGDLKKHMVAVSFQLDGVSPLTKVRTWKPKVYHNCGEKADDPDLNENAVDVCLRSGAAPVFFPTVDGFADGGLVANNPTMVAVSQAITERRGTVAEAKAGGPGFLTDLRVLSVGVGQLNQYLTVQDANWGYVPWLLNPFKPLALLQAMMQGDDMAITYECSRILPPGNMFRLNPYLDPRSMLPQAANTEALKTDVQGPSIQTYIQNTVKWIDESGWMTN
jgi:hypothetical protein